MYNIDAVVVVCSLALWRDCISRVLAAEFPNIPVLAFPDLREWGSVSEWHGHSPLLLISEAGGDVDLEDISKILEHKSDMKVVVLSKSSNISRILEVMSVGVQAYIPNNLTLEIAMKAIHLVLVGGSFFPATSFLEKKAVHSSGSVGLNPNEDLRISRRELDIIAGVSCGRSNASIAKALNLRESTIKVHVRNIMKKIGVNTRTAIAYRSKDIFYSSLVNKVYSSLGEEFLESKRG
ncbi:response regulator transcription factor [Labrys sp. KNU-23]|uniref:response regulator transcription factor n=1 Tax=Labrys sp. KNU-23 TaxID=2789216 RepID=UPI0011EF411A|nr:response regulator transcription factor [Labrys sp. KNU-23]QEN86046.1 response regulator transcription factor [Labrys sp. KNU-23]